MRGVKAVLFDLFDTLVEFRNDRLHVVSLDGREIRSSSPVLYELFKGRWPEVPFETFHRAFVGSWEDVRAEREIDDREVTADVRFQRLFARLGIADAPLEALRGLVATHARQLLRCMECPEANRDLLKRVGARYPLGLVSNFDHAATAWTALEQFELRPCFRSIVISAEVGVRKPRREIFQRALNELRVEPADALFVGDDFRADVVGARRMGLTAVWLDRGRSQPVDGVVPDHTIKELGELEALL
ncbi:MAG: HAD family hydrolase [Deltaproteobacteria bacterium]|nr:HAD family hydrolase [Deltaproteobacteria bacterium]MBI3077255.1 HAD family hydrolase [Deltaproteobacteria bacterium]